ncbi:hypothetical protein KCP76_08310 [Salmonella enterica subsp. enterica serovar Weltevreden]|nr:hypothetical protein KCP76_08310 [Salmonella enterica subsp. enterica serovar Weltevreden]
MEPLSRSTGYAQSRIFWRVAQNHPSDNERKDGHDQTLVITSLSAAAAAVSPRLTARRYVRPMRAHRSQKAGRHLC